MSCLHRQQGPPQTLLWGGSVLLGDFSHLCVCLLSGSSGVDFRQVLSLSWGRHKRTVSVMCGTDGRCGPSPYVTYVCLGE